MLKGTLSAFLILCCALFLFFPLSDVHAGPLAQLEKVNLTILNRSQRSICDVRLAAITNSEWGENQLQGESIGENESVSFPLDPTTYDIALIDCDENILLGERLELSGDYVLVYSQQELQSSDCLAYNEQGMQLFGGGQYDEAIEAFQAAATCYHDLGERANEGANLNNIGFIYSAQGKYPEALEAFEATLVIMIELGNRKGEGIALGNIGGIYRAQGRFAEALEKYEAALVIAIDIEDRGDEGSALLNIGGVYSAQGRFAEALEQFQAALILLHDVGDYKGEGIVLNNMGEIYHEQGYYVDAQEMYETALEIARDLDDSRSEAVTLSNIGGLHTTQAQYTAALQQYEAALQIFTDLGEPSRVATTLNNMGTVYNYQGDFSAALQHFEAALEIRQQLQERAGEGIILHNIGAIYADQGQYAQALALYEAALNIARETEDRQGEFFSLNNIGTVYHQQGRYADALAIYNEVLAILQEVDDPASESGTLNNIGEVYVKEEKYEEALGHFEAALAMIQEMGASANEGIILRNIGSVYAIQRKYVEALDKFEDALTLQQSIGALASEGQILNDIGVVYDEQGNNFKALLQFKSALAIQKQVGDHVSEGTTLRNIGSVYAELGQYDKALSNYEEAMDRFDDVRAVAGSEEGRATFIAQFADIYNAAIQLYLEQGQPAEAFQISERGRARTFLDSLATGQVELIDNPTADLLKREKEAYAIRQAAQDALARAKAIPSPDPEHIAELEAQFAAAEADYNTALAAVEARAGQLADLVPGRNNNVLGLKALQRLLDEETTLISYWMLDEMTIAFIVTKDDFAVVELSEATRNALTTTVKLLDPDRVNREHPHPQPLQRLYEWLVAPLADHLHTPQLVIIPHQSLHYVPFAALSNGTSYFGQQYILSQLPSASVLPFIQENAAQVAHPAAATAVLFGNPKTDLDALPAAETEVTAVAAYFQTPVYTGTAATELQLHTLVSGTQVLHLAAHGSYNTDNPLYSAIYLAPDTEDATENDPENEYDGALETHEIFGLSLQGNDLVVLSACQTNLGELSSGDEVVGLTRAFIFAGAPAVISSLWNVNDKATGVLMSAFYHYWLDEGMSQAAALQAAQADVRANSSWISPFFWAAFTLNGLPGK